MKTKKPTPLINFLSVVVLALLTSCGGGGGGGDSGQPSVATVPSNANLQQAVIASTYSPGSEELAAFNLLNYERNRCGFGLLRQNAQLDAAAKSHGDYQILNDVVSHVEETGKPGFTGVTPSDRIVAKNYLGAGGVTDEIVGYKGTADKTGLGASSIRGLLNAPYHLRGLVGGYREIGVSVRSSTDLASSGTPSVYLQINAAYKTSEGPQLTGSNDVNTYPCEGTTGVNYQLRNETPNPVPNRDLSVNPLGSVVYMAVRVGNTLVLTNTSMIDVSTGQAVPLRPPVTATSDPYAPCQEGCFKSHQAYVAADGPLQKNAAYQVLINGTNNGTAFSRVFTFTTGNGG